MIQNTFRCFTLGLILTACASSPPSRGDRANSANALSGAKIAFPMALALTGMASDADGTIDMAAIRGAALTQFDQFDLNGSQTLSGVEHAGWAEVMLGDRFTRPTLLMLDRDGSGDLSQDEFVRGLERAAQRYDQNQDGLITRNELLIQMPEGRGRSQERGSDGGGRKSRPQR